jgi:hypothetical protein
LLIGSSPVNAHTNLKILDTFSTLYNDAGRLVAKNAVSFDYQAADSAGLPKVNIGSVQGRESQHLYGWLKLFAFAYPQTPVALMCNKTSPGPGRSIGASVIFML